MIDGKLLVEKLIKYANVFLYLDKRDNSFMRNLLLKEFDLACPFSGEEDLSYIERLDVPDVLVKEIEEYALSNNLVQEGFENCFSTRIFGILSPLPSVVNKEFNRIRNEQGEISACKYFYGLSVKNNYVQKTAIGKNLFWKYQDGDKYLEITVNLSKPEKSNKDIAKLLTLKPSSEKYPACLLCKENEGFSGTLSHPSRVNIRTISVNLGNQDWFIQYSPYAYYNEHLIAINEQHTPMHIKEDTIDKLMDFVDYLPNYMIGSNAALPLIGGSILNHEHFQGGEHLMPMHYAKVNKKFHSQKYNEVSVGIVDWYNSVIRLESENREQINGLAKEVVNVWESWTDQDNYIFAETEGVKHNSLSPVCRKEDKKYIFDIILRNNITNEQYPEGVFHAHPEYHNIKREGIGLIEAMGLFILPGRLKNQLKMIAEILSNLDSHEEDMQEGGVLSVHNEMIKQLVAEGYSSTMEQAKKRVIDRVNNVCKNILLNTAVFKADKKGQDGFERLLSCMNLQKK